MSDEKAKLLAALRGLNDAAQVRDDYVRSPFGYPGAKSRSIKTLLEILPYRDIWIDLYAGSGIVTLARRESGLEVFNDRCAGVTSFFRCVRDPVKCKRLQEWLEATVCSREEFLINRETWEKGDFNDEVERAARWYYCVQHSFASKGWSFGRSTSGRSQAGKLYNNLELFWPVCNRLRRTYIENQDWRTIVKDYNTELNHGKIVWYLDPPYWGTSGIYNHELKKEVHHEIAQACMKMSGFVALSGYDDPKHPYNEYEWTRKEQWEIQVSMTGLAFTDTNHLEAYEGSISRGKAKETLWIKVND